MDSHEKYKLAGDFGGLLINLEQTLNWLMQPTELGRNFTFVQVKKLTFD
jgi:hypothetical protein